MIVGNTARLRAEWRNRATLSQLVSFGAVGALTTIVDFAVFNLLMVVTQPVTSNVSGYAAGTYIGWVLNRHFTFNHGARRLGAGVFTVVNLAGLALTSAAVYAAALIVPGDRLLLNATKIAAGVAVMLFKFEVLRRWVRVLSDVRQPRPQRRGAAGRAAQGSPQQPQ